MSNLIGNAEAIKNGSLPSAFGDGRVSFVDPRDVGEMIARALVDPRYEGETWTFGGPAALSYDEVAATLSEVLGRPIAHVRLDEQAFRNLAARAGLPAHVVETISEAARLAPEGVFVASDDAIRRVLGRPASPLRDWVERHRAALTA
jgi:uncharacterized protein YbjT (DUF2867 family)